MTVVKLRRVDYVQLGTTTNKQCLRLLPLSSPNEPGHQKVVVGDNSGVLTCFGRSKDAFNLAFKTPSGQPIENVKLGGALGSIQDKIFIASGSVIKGYSRKGKEFFSFETNFTEPIYNMHIYGIDMFICGSYSLAHYRDCQEVNYFLCTDRINDVLCLPLLEGGWVGRPVTPVLACDDRTLKVLKGSALEYALETGGVPNVLHLHKNSGGVKGDFVLYGAKDGRIGLAQLPCESPSIRWEINAGGSFAAVSALDCYNLSKTTAMDIIVGKQDGSVEIYALEEDDQATFLQQFQNNEGITSLICGTVNSPHYEEIVATSNTGWVFSLTTEPQIKQLVSTHGPIEAKQTAELKNLIEQLKQEIEELQARVNVEREKYQKNTHKDERLSAVPLFPINDQFSLNTEDASYTLALELQSPIDYVLLQRLILDILLLLLIYIALEFSFGLVSYLLKPNWLKLFKRMKEPSRWNNFIASSTYLSE